jgi:hypothetical protein
MTEKAILVTEREISLAYGTLYLLDEDYIFEATDFVPEHRQQGFKRAPSGVIVFTPFDFVKARMQIYKGQPYIPEGCIRAVSFPLTITSGSLIIGEEWVRCPAVIQIDIEPATYLLTVVQELITDAIDGTEGPAQECILVFIERSSSESVQGNVIVADSEMTVGDELVAPEKV